MLLPPLLWPLFSSCLSEPSRHSFIVSLPFPIVALRKADCPPMRQYFDSLSPAYDTSGDGSISTPPQLPCSSPVPALHLQRTGSSIVLTRCSPSRSLLRYSSLLRYPPLMLMLASILPSVSKGRWYEATFSVPPPTLPAAK